MSRQINERIALHRERPNDIGSDEWISHKFRTLGTNETFRHQVDRSSVEGGETSGYPQRWADSRQEPVGVKARGHGDSNPAWVSFGLQGMRADFPARDSKKGGGQVWSLLGISSAEAADAGRVEFSTLWSNYPVAKPYIEKATGKPPKGFENQCAIKVSEALQGSGVDLKSFKGASVSIHGKRAAIRAEELTSWLANQSIPGIGKGEIITGKDWEERIKNRKGIISFENYWARPGETSAPTGDHIDLWNGSRLTASGFAGSLVTMGRYMGIDSMSVPGTPLQYSDLGKSTRIRFFEVK